MQDDSEEKRQPVSIIASQSIYIRRENLFLTLRQVSRVHVDQTPEASARRVHMHMPPEIAPELLKHRFQIINFWRPISHIALDWPLALCDYRTLDWEKDLVPTDLKFSHRVGETYIVLYNPNHKWNYLRGMTPDEAVLVKW